MKCIVAASLFVLGAFASPSPDSLKPLHVQGLVFSGSASQIKVSFNVTDENTNATAFCSYFPVKTGGLYDCNNNTAIMYDFADDWSSMSVEWTWAKGVLDDSDAYYKGNGSAKTGKLCAGSSSGSTCVGAEDIFIPITTVQGVA